MKFRKKRQILVQGVNNQHASVPKRKHTVPYKRRRHNDSRDRKTPKAAFSPYPLHFLFQLRQFLLFLIKHKQLTKQVIKRQNYRLHRQLGNHVVDAENTA